MNVPNMFYGFAIFFLLITIGYFVSSYLEDVPYQIKTILSFTLAVILFIFADLLRRKNI